MGVFTVIGGILKKESMANQLMDIKVNVLPQKAMQVMIDNNLDFAVALLSLRTCNLWRNWSGLFQLDAVSLD